MNKLRQIVLSDTAHTLVVVILEFQLSEKTCSAISPKSVYAQDLPQLHKDGQKKSFWPQGRPPGKLIRFFGSIDTWDGHHKEIERRVLLVHGKGRNSRKAFGSQQSW